MGAQLQACGRICGSAEPTVSAREAAAASGKTEWVPVAGTPVQDEGFICMGGPAPICPTGPGYNKGAWVPVAGTPIKDEGFICMGGPAPICPAGAREAVGLPVLAEPIGPITLDVLQGAWVGSSGSSITVFGTEIFINGLPLSAHKVELDDDGIVVSIGRLWQVWGPYTGVDGEQGIEFRASSTREGMESARSETWLRPDMDPEEWTNKMKLMGYAGSSADPLGRGIEGCCPGTMGIEAPMGYAESRDKKDVALLQALISQWREPTTEKVLSRDVLPDFTNRSQTGLGVELVHFVAICMADRGFQTRKGTHGHDIPVVVREPVGSVMHDTALEIWKKRVGDEEGFPPVRVAATQEIFTSLGNGHFFQALNLFACECKGINQERVYRIGKDAELRSAIEKGVPSIVLKHETPKPVRSKIAELLNSKREFHWALTEDGQVDLGATEEDTTTCSQFEWLSKGMDAEQVNCLVRIHLGIKESKRIVG